MILSVIFGFAFCLSTYVESAGVWHNTRIVGGKPANITEFPYQLTIEDLEGFAFCGATIIDHIWALTAAHCLVGFAEADIRVRSGSNKRNEGGTIHKVVKIVRDPKYNSSCQDHDAALLKISPSFNYSATVNKIELTDKTPEPGAPAIVSGYGQLAYQGEYALHLQKVTIYIIDRKECDENYRQNYNLTSTMMCAGVPQGGRDACAGDSGGPLVVDKKLVGIVSWGEHCAEKGRPGVYTDVTKVRDWINATIAK